MISIIARQNDFLQHLTTRIADTRGEIKKEFLNFMMEIMHDNANKNRSRIIGI